MDIFNWSRYDTSLNSEVNIFQTFPSSGPKILFIFSWHTLYYIILFFGRNLQLPQRFRPLLALLCALQSALAVMIQPEYFSLMPSRWITVSQSTWWQNSSSCPHFLHVVLSARPMCRCLFLAQWPNKNPVTVPKYFLPKASRSIEFILRLLR
jgi:hypothetical protein